ncbi:MAG TPA: serine/threonine-protein kinase [Anaeromyxobacter sp.]|nr:serine/threonine-protein kinase [Anaeromyxobacter sp.]
MKTCPSCTVELPPQAAFCLACGARIPVDAAPAPDPFIGTTVKDTYHVEARIGGGGMGDVYLARHVTLDVPVALKILKRSLLADKALVQRFQREARAASRLRHPNIVQVTDFGQLPDGTLFMAMEHVEGKDLSRVIAEESPVPERRAVHLGAQILSALAEAHAHGILHRDLKPGNVMIEARRHERDVVKVLDFGIAKLQEAEAPGATLTQTGVVCGTPGYMSPEQWNAAPLDPRSDLYAVGVILYELLTGRRPLDGQTPLEMVRKLLTEAVPPPGALRPGQISPALEALVMRALSTVRENRPESADRMREELLACPLVGLPGRFEPAPAAAPRTMLLPNVERAAEPPAPPRPAAPALRRARPRLSRAAIAGGAAALVLAGLAVSLSLVVNEPDAPAEEPARPELTLRTPGAPERPPAEPASPPAPDPAAAPSPPTALAPAAATPSPPPTGAAPAAPKKAPSSSRPEPPRVPTGAARVRARPRSDGAVHAAPVGTAEPAPAAPEPLPTRYHPAEPAPGAPPPSDPSLAPEAERLVRRGPSLAVVEFKSASAARSGAIVTDTIYSERSGDVHITDRDYEDGVVTYSGVVGRGRGSSWAGIGLSVYVKKDYAWSMDASVFRSLRIWLASSTVPQLRLRLLGTDMGTMRAGCYPMYVQPVTSELTAYEIPLSRFAPEPHCGPKGRSVAETLPVLSGFEIVDNAITGAPTTFSVGAIHLEP